MLLENVVYVASIATAAVCPSIERSRKKKDFAKQLAEHQADVAKEKAPLKSTAPAIDLAEVNARDEEIARLQKKLGLR